MLSHLAVAAGRVATPPRVGGSKVTARATDTKVLDIIIIALQSRCRGRDHADAFLPHIGHGGRLDVLLDRLTRSERADGAPCDDGD